MVLPLELVLVNSIILSGDGGGGGYNMGFGLLDSYLKIRITAILN